MQPVSFTASLKTEIEKISSVKQLAVAHMQIVEFHAFANVLTALVLFLTLPVTVASAERSFSELKIIVLPLQHYGAAAELTLWSFSAGHRSLTCKFD